MEMNQIKRSAGQILSEVKKQIKLDSIMVCDGALYSKKKYPINLKFKMVDSSPNDFKKGQRNN